jgi:hypothetical protein
MTPIQRQIEMLREKHPGSIAQPLQSGAHLITVPDVPLPEGWNRRHVTVYFLAPVGYPAAQPDCFWVDQPALRLADNQTMPQNTNEMNPIPEVGMKGTWFSWHLQSWNPNQGTLLTFFNVIRQRFDPAR